MLIVVFLLRGSCCELNIFFEIFYCSLIGGIKFVWKGLIGDFVFKFLVDYVLRYSFILIREVFLMGGW